MPDFADRLGRHARPADRKKWVRINPNRPAAKKGSPRREPVAYAALVPLLITVAAWLGFDELDTETALAIIGGVVGLASIVRQFVTPVADPVVTPSEDVAVNPEAGESAVNVALVVLIVVVILVVLL